MSRFTWGLASPIFALIMIAGAHGAQVRLAPGNGIWLNPSSSSSPVVGHEAARVDALKARSIKHVFLWTTGHTSSQYAAYVPFVSLAHANGMTVHAICASKYTVTTNLLPDLLQNYINQVVTHNISHPEAPFDGVQIDIEGVSGARLFTLVDAVSVPETLVFSADVQPGEFYSGVESYYASLLQDTDLDMLIPMIYIMDGIIYKNYAASFTFNLAKIQSKTASILAMLPSSGQMMTGISGYDREFPVSKATGGIDWAYFESIGSELSHPAFSTVSGSWASVPNLVASGKPLVSVSYLTATGVSAYRFDRSPTNWIEVLEMSPIGLRRSVGAADQAGTNDSRYVGTCTWVYHTAFDPYIGRHEGLSVDDGAYPNPAIGLEVLGTQGSLVRLRVSLTNTIPPEQILGAHQAAGAHLRIEGNGFFVSAARGGFHAAEAFDSSGNLLPSINGAKIIELRRSFFENSAAPGVLSGEIVITSPSWVTLKYRGWMMNKDSICNDAGTSEPYVARTPDDVHYMTPSRFLTYATFSTNLVVSQHASYAAAILADNPVCYHRFSETGVVSVPAPFTAANSGTASPGGYGAAAVTNDWRSTSILGSQPGALALATNKCFKFAGGSDTNQIVVPYRPEWNVSGPFTIELWLKGGTNFSCPAGSVEFDKRGWLLYQGNAEQTSGNGWFFRVYETGLARVTVQADMTVNPNTWYHVAGVYNGSSVLLYVNGALVDSTALSGAYLPNTNTAYPFTFGARHSANSWPYGGYIDEAAFYTNALTASQIAAHYAAATTNASGYAAHILAHNPAGYWHFDEGLNPPKAANFGSAGPSADGAYLDWSTTIPELEAPTWPGLETANRVLQLFGTNGQAVIPPLNLNTNSVTFECLIKRNGNQQNQDGIVVHRNADGGGASACGLSFRGSYNHLGYNWNDSAGAYTWDSGLTVPDGQWCYAALAVSPTQAVLCLCDGTTWATATRSASHPAQPFAGFTRIGTDTGTNRWFDGLIDEIAIYNTALSQTQMRAHALSAFGNTNQPLFTLTPASQTVEVGFPVSLSGSAIGVPTISYQWQRSGEDIPGATSAVFSLPETDYTNAGQYRLSAANDYGIVLSPPATLVVWPPSSVTNLSYRSATTAEGSSLELIWQYGSLYSADDLSGPWNLVKDAAPPYYRVPFAPAVEKRFFRLE